MKKRSGFGDCVLMPATTAPILFHLLITLARSFLDGGRGDIDISRTVDACKRGELMLTILLYSFRK